MHLCMCTRVYGLCVHVCKYVLWRPEIDSLYLVFWDRVSHWTWNTLIWLYWLSASPTDAPVPASHDAVLSVYIGAGNPDSGPPVCAAMSPDTILLHACMHEWLIERMNEKKSWEKVGSEGRVETGQVAKQDLALWKKAHMYSISVVLKFHKEGQGRRKCLNAFLPGWCWNTGLEERDTAACYPPIAGS